MIACVLTVSDRCFAGTAEDRSGPALEKALRESPIGVTRVSRDLCADEIDTIAARLRRYADEDGAHLVVTTGGTGFAQRDVTPEATRQVVDRLAESLSQLMLVKSLEVTPMAALSRAVCGVRKQTLIVNVPGSPKAACECLSFLLPVLPHALDLIRGEQQKRVAKVHATMQQQADETTSTSQPHTHVCSHHHHHHHQENNARTPLQLSSGDTPVSRRPRTSPYPMIPMSEATSTVLSHAAALTPVTMPFGDALHHTLAEDVHAASPVPPFAASVKDGYAVIAADGVGDFDVVSVALTAGADPSECAAPLRPRQVARISTGAPLPPGADAVVQVEDTVLLESSEDGRVELRVRVVTAAPCAGHDVRAVGSDIALDERVLAKGTLLLPAELGLLATVGVTSVLVYPLPRVSVLSTGNELVEPSHPSPLPPSHIRDANRSTLLASLAQSHSAQPHDAGIASDDLASLVSHLTSLLPNSDVILTSGGVSMGELDLLRPALAALPGAPATLHFARVFMKPGKPTTFATIDYNGRSLLFFGLPGNPVSAHVTFVLHVLPALYKMAGKSHEHKVIGVKTSARIRLDPRPEYHRVTLTYDRGTCQYTAHSTGSQCSSRLLSNRSADALLVLPPRTDDKLHIEQGEVVDAILL